MGISNSGSLGRGKAFDIFVRLDPLDKAPEPDVSVASPTIDLKQNYGQTEEVSSSLKTISANVFVVVNSKRTQV